MLTEADLSDQSEQAAAADEDWLVTSYVYDINREYAQILSETTGDEAVRYECGLERTSAYAADGKTEYVYDGRGSAVRELITGYVTGAELSEKVKKVIKGYTPLKASPDVYAVGVTGLAAGAEENGLTGKRKQNVSEGKPSYGKSNSNISQLLSDRPELTGSNRDKLLSMV